MTCLSGIKLAKKSSVSRRRTSGFRSCKGSLVVSFDCLDGVLELGLVHRHQVSGFRKNPGLHVSGVFFEGSDALLLQTIVFREKVPVGLGMARNPFVVICEDVVREQE